MMDLIVTDEIKENEQSKAVFRTQEMLERYKRNLLRIKGHYLMTGSSYHCDELIHLFFSEYGYRYVSPENVDSSWKIIFVRQNYLLGRNGYDKRVYDVKCRIKNIVKLNNISPNVVGKSYLYKFIPQSMVPTVDWQDFSYTDGVWMVKIERAESFGGRDNKIITSLDEWNQARQEIFGIIEKNDPKNRFIGAIVSKYITNPLLYQGKKCHFRPYIMLRSWDKSVLSNFSTLITAKELYRNDDYYNADIHDTHLRSTYQVTVITDVNIIDAITKVCQPLLELLDKYPVVKYPESEYGYRILAPDILLDENYNAYILEVNTEPVLGGHGKPGLEEFEKVFCPWEFSNGILPNI